MGCHTWAYEKVDVNIGAISSMHKSILDKLPKEIKELSEYMSQNVFADWSEEEIAFWNSELEHLQESNIKAIEGTLSVEELINLYIRESKELDYSNGELLIDVDYHDMFRTNYTEAVLQSYEETIDFINNNDCWGLTYLSVIQDKLITDPIDLNEIKEFWDEHPNGLINFG